MSVCRFPAAALVLFVVAGITGCSTTVQQSVAEARVESLIGRMTVEEKVGQLSLYAPAGVDIVANPQAAKQS